MISEVDLKPAKYVNVFFDCSVSDFYIFIFSGTEFWSVCGWAAWEAG